jgi:hypothetical protein
MWGINLPRIEYETDQIKVENSDFNNSKQNLVKRQRKRTKTPTTFSCHGMNG